MNCNQLVIEVFTNFRDGGLQKLCQSPELTFYRSGGGDPTDLFLWPFGGKRRHVGYSSCGASGDDRRFRIYCKYK